MGDWLAGIDGLDQDPVSLTKLKSEWASKPSGYIELADSGSLPRILDSTPMKQVVKDRFRKAVEELRKYYTELPSVFHPTTFTDIHF